MVDPNRKINRLTDKDIEFLDECEEEFANRFTEEDEEFMQHFSKPLADPPIVDNWNFIGNNHNQNSYRGGGQRNNFYNSEGDRGGMRNNRGWNNRRSNDRGPNRNFGRNRYQNSPYSRDQHHNNDRRYNDDRGAEGGGERTRPPMNVRRDYGNFVAASKD